MGCDIHLVAQKKEGGKWVDVDTDAFDHRSYSVFGFLAGVRNYSAVTPIAEPRGLPDDFGERDADFMFMRVGDHSFSWLSVSELISFNYEATFEDRRENGSTLDKGKGTVTTYREFLGRNFFDDLKKLQQAGVDRIVFGFDN